MNAIYKIIGEDGQEYGPATAEQIRQWITEGRANQRTAIYVEGATDWSFVGLLPEFTNSFTAPGMPPIIAPLKPGTATAGQPGRSTNSNATTGLIFGILSVMCCCGLPFGVLGLVFSLVALSQISANPQLQEGRGLAIAGLVLSIVSLLLGAGWLFTNVLISQSPFLWNFSWF